jgi:hypothetical protein
MIEVKGIEKGQIYYNKGNWAELPPKNIGKKGRENHN